MLRVLYAAHADGNEKVKNIIHAMNDVERAINFVMKDTGKGWTSKISTKKIEHYGEEENGVEMA
ncbi:hypothetical protein [Pusillimonas noertemannii]|uniref:Uncharacterized protein n=1 Tax=Pusillimonas noertemannii TaxID=305977 RepID=A0A2U1CSJ8_9BURK|nr:hypothetical protein [Pusillimonas noertemannii]NYT68157.1 hypothetical protein [Pusillimonas noertemannii]PVY68833.1 hypothetical protein C7440_1246 [Pusillimonas noertemannii]TFL11713.1 hypothetical protein CSC72_00850 [Pusillimonas noertemannii]